MEPESSKGATVRGASKRLQKKRRIDSEEDVPAEATNLPKRRVKKSGKLADLMSMPIDVLLEVFSHLKPYDLLKLARVTKDFRRVLMSRNSISVWIAARANVPGLPDCPADMTEPEYANLAFDPRCHYCSAHVRTVEWHFRARICGKCGNDILTETWFHFLSNDYLQEDTSGYSTQHNHEILQTLIPWRPGKKHSQVFLTSDLFAFKEKLQALKGLKADTQNEFFQARTKLVADRAAHARQCEAWAQTQADDRSAELQELRDERKQAIVEKLIALGWEKELLGIRRPDSLEYHKLVGRPQKLTTRIWNKIEPEMIIFMKKMQTKRLAREHAALVIDRKRIAISVLRTFKRAHLPHTELMPEPPDFCNFAEIKAILEKPSEVEVTESSFGEIIPLIPELISKWRDDVHQQFVRLHQQPTIVVRRMFPFDDSGNRDEDLSGSMVSGTLEGLKLATAIFTCNGCGIHGPANSLNSHYDDDSLIFEPLTYPHVLGHSCLTRLMNCGWDPMTDTSTRLESTSNMRKRWSCELLSRRNTALAEIARMLILKAGQDPNIITSVEMDQLKVKFACMVEGCPHGTNGQRKASLYNWRQAVTHHDIMHGDGAPTHWVVVDEATVDRKRIIPSTAQPAMWCCAHCSDLPIEHDKVNLDTIKSHLLSSHKVEDPQVNVDYYRPFSVPEHVEDPDVCGGSYLMLLPHEELFCIRRTPIRSGMELFAY